MKLDKKIISLTRSLLRNLFYEYKKYFAELLRSADEEKEIGMHNGRGQWFWVLILFGAMTTPV